MDERAFLAPESLTPWEYEPPGPGETAAIRWRTLVSAGRTPTADVSMGVLEVPPGARLAPHRHGAREVYYVMLGVSEVLLDGAWRPVRAGDVAYFPGGAVHGVRNRGTFLCRIVWIFPVDDYESVVYEDVTPEGDTGS